MSWQQAKIISCERNTFQHQIKEAVENRKQTQQTVKQDERPISEPTHAKLS